MVPAAPATHGAAAQEASSPKRRKLDVDEGQGYFCEYGRLSEHRTMLQDSVRCEAFRSALERCCAGRVVMDLGCGSGLLAVLAARAGARHVVAVEAAPNAAELARAVARAAGFDEKRVKVFGGQPVEQLAEDIDAHLCALRAVDAADSSAAASAPAASASSRGVVEVLVSEWMGFALLYEGMFRSVAFARDRWLDVEKGGIMIPSGCDLFAAPFSYADYVQDILGFWHSRPCGLDMSAAALPALQQSLEKPVIELLPSSSWSALEGVSGEDDGGGGAPLAEGVRIWRLDCSKARPEDVAEVEELTFDCSIMGEQTSEFHGICLWFACQMLPSAGPDGEWPPLLLSTGPRDPPTHWAQTLLFVEPRLQPSAADADASDDDEELPHYFPRARGGDRVSGSLGLRLLPDAAGSLRRLQLQLDVSLVSETSEARCAGRSANTWRRDFILDERTAV
eukprot:TRINITY_DN65856_c0_g1_i1.p1 TRINITY_DN65856_c0_g1~~TRINITY_DN65856_c0_g1_i1.p1  ORF type:complete len:469 (-),score=96.71 TRINITY_DN65856_c0_g1_i1:20-1372(-)